jgi:DHA1 family bicyclomycin/chloramphenicol resistance-like MFS transporter
MALHCIASAVAIAASSFETCAYCRGSHLRHPRDCDSSRRMASVMSLAMTVFVAVQVIAPSLGEAVLLLTTQLRGAASLSCRCCPERLR